MAVHHIKKGLRLPISGEPVQEIRDAPEVTRVALLGHDYPTMKPRMHVADGDRVSRGQLLFEDRKARGVRFTAPAAGTVQAIHRGDKRAFQSLVIELSDGETASQAPDKEQVAFENRVLDPDGAVTGEQARALLSESGLWTAVRTRPFSRVPALDEACQAIFVTATDTNPLAPAVETVIAGQEEAFVAGLRVLSALTEGPVYLCVGPAWRLETPDVDRLQTEVFSGPHPAGLPGTHIHLLAPASRKRTVWHVNYQDVIAAGHLFASGILHVERIVSVAGPAVDDPCLVRSRLGAATTQLTAGKLPAGVETRIVSGSVLHGHTAGDEVFGYLNRYDHQVSCLAEDRERVFMGWLMPGTDKFSTIRTFLSRFLPGRKFPLTTTNHGSRRAMVPIGVYERLMPLDILPTFLLRSLLMSDLERAEELGCLELHEEDLALCSFASPGKEDYGKVLRKVLDELWREG